MKLKIGIVPSIKQNYKNQFSYSIDFNWFIFFKKIFKNPDIEILTNKKVPKLDLVVITGGNTIKDFSKKKEDKIRQDNNILLFKEILKKKIPCIGICYGAQLISHFYSGNLIKSKNHVGQHKITLVDEKNNFFKHKKFNVNSFHDQGIKKIKKPLRKIFISKDGNIEMFLHEKNKVLGIMWHPERNLNVSKLDKIIFQKILCN